MFSGDNEVHYCYGDLSTAKSTLQADLESTDIYVQVYLVDS